MHAIQPSQSQYSVEVKKTIIICASQFMLSIGIFWSAWRAPEKKPNGHDLIFESIIVAGQHEMVEIE